MRPPGKARTRFRCREKLAGMLPVDTAFVSAKALEGLPNSDLLSEAEVILHRVTAQLQTSPDRSRKRF